MNIQTIQCPSCDGNLEVKNVNQSLVYCMFCGASISFETNHNKGYDMELGRLDARGEMADEILEKLEKIKDELIRNGNAEIEVPRKFRNDRVLGYIIKGFQAREFVLLEQAFFKSEEMFGI